MNLAALRTRVRSLTSILSTTILTDAELDAFINEAQTLLCLAADWPFLVHTAEATTTVSVDTVSLTLPAGRTAQRVIDVYARSEVGAKPWQLFERAQPRIQEENTAYPRDYEWDSATNTLTLYPIPSDPFIVTARVVLDPTTMVLSTDVPLIPASFRHGIAYMASALILEREADNTGRIQSYERRVSEVIDEMKRLLLASSRPTLNIGGRIGRRRSARNQVW
jgi:hypothetical protein